MSSVSAFKSSTFTASFRAQPEQRRPPVREAGSQKVNRFKRLLAIREREVLGQIQGLALVSLGIIIGLILALEMRLLTARYKRRKTSRGLPPRPGYLHPPVLGLPPSPAPPHSERGGSEVGAESPLPLRMRREKARGRRQPHPQLPEETAVGYPQPLDKTRKIWNVVDDARNILPAHTY